MAVYTRAEDERASYILHSTYPKRLRAFGSNGRICSVCWEMGNLFAEKMFLLFMSVLPRCFGDLTRSVLSLAECVPPRMHFNRD